MARADQEQIDSATVKDLVQSLKDIAEQGNSMKQLPTHLKVPNTPFNRAGVKRVKLVPPSFSQNGARINENRLTNAEITLINQLKTGLYNKKKWRVERKRDRSIHLSYPNKTLQQRMELHGEAANLEIILQKIVMEQESQAKARQAGKIIDEYDE